MKYFNLSACLPRFGEAKALAAVVLLAGAASFAGSARAENVFWSIGVASPGVAVAVTNAHPVPIYVQPAPVFVQPRPVYRQLVPVYVQPVLVQTPVWAPPGRAHGRHKKHHHEREHSHFEPQAYGQGYAQAYGNPQWSQAPQWNQGPQWNHGPQGYAQPAYGGR